MDSYSDSESSESDEEWDQRCEEAVAEQNDDMESRLISERMHDLNVGYNPLKGYPSGFDTARWFRGDVQLKDVVTNFKLNTSVLKTESMTPDRLENFIDCARMCVHRHRKKVPGTVSTTYIECVAAAMIKWQFDL